MPKVYDVHEGASGILTLTCVSSRTQHLYIPNYSLVAVKEHLHSFYDTELLDGRKVKNSFCLSGRNWFHTGVSQLYWQLFRPYVMYQPLIDQYSSGKVDFTFQNHLRFFEIYSYAKALKLRNTFKSSVSRNLRFLIRICINLLIVLRNIALFKPQRRLDKSILLYSLSPLNFRLLTIKEKVRQTFPTIYMAHLSNKQLFASFSDRNLFIAPHFLEDLLPLRTFDSCLPNDSLPIYKIAYAFTSRHISSLRAAYLFNKLQFNRFTFRASCLLSLDECNYIYPLIFRHSDLGIKTIGIQHGAYTEHHEAYVMSHLTKPDWFDYLLVWSPYWRELFLKYNKHFDPRKIYPTEPKLPHNLSPVSGVDFASRHVLVPFEFLTNTFAVGNAIQELVSEGFKITFKLRPDFTPEEQIASYHLPEQTQKRIRSVLHVDQDLLNSLSIILGTSTTYLYDICELGIPIWILKNDLGLNHEILSLPNVKHIDTCDGTSIASYYEQTVLEYRPFVDGQGSLHNSTAKTIEHILNLD